MGLARALIVSCLLAAAPLAAAQGAPATEALAVELAPPASLHVGDRAEVIARVRGAGTHPILVTPTSEGTAVEVVRGRLMRSDAREPGADVLELRVPVVARSAGAAVLRVVVRGYRCAARCALVEVEARAVLQVAGQARGARKQDGPAVAPRTSSLSWVRMPGAEGCVGSSALARAVEARLERRVFVSASAAALAVEGRAEPRDGGGWRAVLGVSGADGESLGERTLESDDASCEELGALVAVTVALMIDPLTAPEPTPARATPTPEPPPPQVIVRTERVEVPVPAEAITPPAERWRVEIDAALVGTVGLLPTLALAGLTSIILEPPGFVPVLLEGALVPWSRAARADGRHADFLHFHAGLSVCPLAIREGGLAVHGCIGADAGAVFVVGGDLDVAEGERVIGQAHAALRGHWDVVGPLTLRAGLHLLVPFRHDGYLVQGTSELLYAPEPIAGMLDIGAGLHFP